PHAVGLQPDAHRILAAAQDIRIAHAAEAAQLGNDVDTRKVVEKLLVGMLVFAVEVDVHEHVRRGVVDDNTLALHEFGQPAGDLFNPVLDVYHRLAGIHAEVKDDLDGRLAGTRGV